MQISILSILSIGLATFSTVDLSIVSSAPVDLRQLKQQIDDQQQQSSFDVQQFNGNGIQNSNGGLKSNPLSSADFSSLIPIDASESNLSPQLPSTLSVGNDNLNQPQQQQQQQPIQHSLGLAPSNSNSIVNGISNINGASKGGNGISNLNSGLASQFPSANPVSTSLFDSNTNFAIQPTSLTAPNAIAVPASTQVNIQPVNSGITSPSFDSPSASSLKKSNSILNSPTDESFTSLINQQSQPNLNSNGNANQFASSPLSSSIQQPSNFIGGANSNLNSPLTVQPSVDQFQPSAQQSQLPTVSPLNVDSSANPTVDSTRPWSNKGNTDLEFASIDAFDSNSVNDENQLSTPIDQLNSNDEKTTVPTPLSNSNSIQSPVQPFASPSSFPSLSTQSSVAPLNSNTNLPFSASIQSPATNVGSTLPDIDSLDLNSNSNSVDETVNSIVSPIVNSVGGPIGASTVNGIKSEIQQFIPTKNQLN